MDLYGTGTTNSDFSRYLNLDGMESIGGCFEENDHFKLVFGLHFDPAIAVKKKLLGNPQ